jgi:hypothetical protein
MEHDLVCHDIGSMGSMGSMGSVSSMASGISSSRCIMIFSFVGPSVLRSCRDAKCNSDSQTHRHILRKSAIIAEVIAVLELDYAQSK